MFIIIIVKKNFYTYYSPDPNPTINMIKYTYIEDDENTVQKLVVMKNNVMDSDEHCSSKLERISIEHRRPGSVANKQCCAVQTTFHHHPRNPSPNSSPKVLTPYTTYVL